MVAAQEYSLETQTKIVPANVIHAYDPEEVIEPEQLIREQPRCTDEDFSRQDVLNQEKARAKNGQDVIAKEMWAQYQEYLGTGGEAETS